MTSSGLAAPYEHSSGRGDARAPFTPVTVAGTPGGATGLQAAHLALLGGGARWASTRPGPAGTGGRPRAWMHTSAAAEGERRTSTSGPAGARPVGPEHPGGTRRPVDAS